MGAYFRKVKHSWHDAWQNKVFKYDLIFGLIMLAVLFTFTSFFFDYIQNLPGGTTVYDWVLKKLPARDVSLPIVLLEASVFVLLFARCSTHPKMFLAFLISSILIYATRDITIGITQLRAPAGIIELKDPIAGMVYKSGFVTRDLFYSGHVSFVFLVYLCSHNKRDKQYVLFAVIIIGFLLLVQHVHYVIDVISAPFFSFCCFWITKRLLRLQKIIIQ